jgi:type IV secretion system protein VirB10
MFANSIAALMIASILTAQTPVPDPQTAPTTNEAAPDPAAQNAPASAPRAATSPAAAASSITIPVGTAIPLTLMTLIKSKSTKPGDSVRAVVAFPVTVGTQMAIPAGTYVEGVVNKVTAKPLSNQAPLLSVRFTRLVFTNGYSAPVSAENSQALLAPPNASAPANEVAELLPLQLPGQHFAMGEGQQTLPTLPPLQRVGPNPGVVIGISLGATAAFGIGMLIWAHHRANSYDFAVFDVGWQFQMVLDNPVTLDATQVAAAAAMTPPSVN